MKKNIPIMMVLVLVLLTATAFADDTIYITDYDFTITPPAGFMNLTRDIQEDDENLAAMGLTKDALVSYFEQQGIYYGGLTSDMTVELTISTTQDEETLQVVNFNSLSDFKLQTYGEGLIEATKEGMAASYNSYEIYKVNDLAYLECILSHEENGTMLYTKQYLTIVNGDAIFITLNDYTGAQISDENSNILKGVVDSLTFGHIDEVESKSSPLTMIVAAFVALVIVAVVVVLIKNSKKKKDEFTE